MATKVLDSYALMAFFGDEPGADIVRDLILKAEETKVSLADVCGEFGRSLVFHSSYKHS